MAQTTSLVFNGGAVPSPAPTPTGSGKAKLLKIGEITITEHGVQVTKKVICDPDSVTSVAPFMEVLTSAKLAELVNANSILVLADGDMQYLMANASVTVEDDTPVCTSVSFLGLSKENRAKVAYNCTRITDELTLQQVIEVGEPVETNFNLVIADSEDTSPNTLIDKMEVVDDYHDPDDPDSPPMMLQIGTIEDEQGNRKVAIDESELSNKLDFFASEVGFIEDQLGELPSDEHGYFNSSPQTTPGDGTTTSINIYDFRISKGRDVHGESIEFVPTHKEGEVDFGEVYLNPGTYILNVHYTLQWVGNPRGTFLPLVTNVGDQPFDFSYEHEDIIRSTRIVTKTTRGKLGLDFKFDADTPPMGVCVKNLEIAQIASYNHPAVAHDTTLTGTGKLDSPLGVTSDAFGKVKDIPTSISQFRNGDVIPVDGPNGPAKMNKDDLLTETAQNALAGYVAPEFDPTRTSKNPYKAGESVVYAGKAYTFKVDHYGAWVVADVYLNSASKFLQKKESSIKGVDEYSSSALEEYSCSVSKALLWYGLGKHVAIKLYPGQKVKVAPVDHDGILSIVTSDYIPGNQSAESRIPQIDNFSSRIVIPENCNFEWTASERDAYLILCVVVGDAQERVEWNIKEFNNLLLSNISLENSLRLGKILKETDFTRYTGIVNSTGSYWYSESAAAHIEIPCIQGLLIYVKPSIVARARFFTGIYKVGDKFSTYAIDNDGNDIFYISDEGYYCKPGDSDKYLVLPVVDGGGNAVTYDIQYLPLDSVSNVINSIPVDYYYKYSGTPGDNGNWFAENGAKHIAIRLKPGDVYEIKSVSYDAVIALVTGEYLPSDKTRGTTVPFSSRFNGRFVVRDIAPFEFTAQSDEAYLIVSVVSGAGTDVDVEICEKLGCSQDVRKIRYAHWNIGHFSMGKSENTAITPTDKPKKQLEYRELINSVAPDILSVCEDDAVFSTDGSRSLDCIYSCFFNKRQGVKYGYNCNSLYFNLRNAKDFRTYFFGHASQPRYIHELEFIWNGKKVIVAESHLDFDSNFGAQVLEVINRYHDEEYVIISADWNGKLDAQYEPFLKAGWNMAWLDYMPHVSTYAGQGPEHPAEDVCIDNVMVKGFSISNVHLIEESSSLSDHIMVACDLTFKEK